MKPIHTLDLVVSGSSGARPPRGWLSNIHLGARDPAGGFVMLGKTFKGMTDEMLEWQTERFLELEDHSATHCRRGAPRAGRRDRLRRAAALDPLPGRCRAAFARVLRYRDDKTADEADTIDTVQAFLQL